MALTNLTSTSFVAPLYPTPVSGTGANGNAQTGGNTAVDEGGLLRAALEGKVGPVMKIVGGDGGPDWVFTGNSAGAESVTFDAPILSLLKLYAAQQSGVTRLVVKAKVSARSVAVATSDYWEIAQCFDDIAGTMTAVGTQAAPIAIEGAATTDPTLTISTANVRTTVTTLAAAAIRVELYVNQVQ
jgi:hypothetical protein